MKCFITRTTVALTLGLGLALALLLGLSEAEGWALGGLPTAHAAPAATTRYVAPDGDDGYNCNSVANRCRTVQRAVDVANGGDEILVATGAYTGVQTREGEIQVIYISKTMTIRGGYDTTFTTWDPDTQPTTVDAQGQGRAIYVLGSPTAPITLTLEGLQLTNGTGDEGGGAHVRFAHLTLKRCRVFSNTASSRGGGMYLSTFENTTLVDNRAYDNEAADGGGLYLDASHQATLSGNRIYSNTATASGGGVYLSSSDNVRLADNQIYSNTASSSGGGVHLPSSDGDTLSGNAIYGNQAKYGGGVCLAANNDAVLTGNDVSDNGALNGGGIFLQNAGNATLSNNRVYSNTASTNGGGVYLNSSDDAMLAGNRVYSNTAGVNGGGIFIFASENALLVNNVIAGNRLTGSGDGTGIRVHSSDAHLLHTTIARNRGGGGSGVAVSHGGSNYSTVALTNTVLVSHTTGIYVSAGDAATLEITLWGSGVWANGDEWGGLGTVITGTDLYGDPAFVAPDGGDYHITYGSAARDAAADAGTVDDIDGDSRLFDAQPDVGADEYACHVRLNGTPYPTVQNAVDVATGGDVVQVAGTCRGMGVYTAVAFITKSLTIRGGYSSDFSTWDPDGYPATLDAQGQGRVVYVYGQPAAYISVTIEGLRVTNGSAAAGSDTTGGGICSVWANVVVSDCRVYGNTASGSAGGIYASSADSAMLIGNDVYSNTAPNGTGGGMYIGKFNDVTLANNTVHNNRAKFTAGIYLAQIITDTVLVNNVVADNQLESAFGAGIRLRTCNAHLLHNTIARNTGGSGEGIYVSNASTVWMTNTILVGHAIGIWVDSSSAVLEATLWGEGAWANVTDTVGSSIATGTVNVRGDPAFLAPAEGDYHVGVASAAIDAGVNAGIATDLDGDMRPWPAGGGYDIGADEMQYLSVHLPLVLSEAEGLVLRDD
ncbi:MAG: right-handed parallel beta-helix repeat-containing protein [Anaerolineae bacterium]|nr:right-handed parallel beta-helix repeat-containing protein [Anaerolineae bacterium]